MNIVIIGSGIAAITFAEKMRQLSDAKITVLTSENHGYYSRPMLSRGFSNENIEQSIIIKAFADLREQNIQIIENICVSSVDCDKQLVYVSNQSETHSYVYDQLVFATGSAAFIPPPLLSFRDNFFLFNSLDDLIQIRNFRDEISKGGHVPEWAVVGGGLIGCEIASDLAVTGDKVSIFHIMNRLMERQLCEQDSDNLLSVMQKHHISVNLEQSVQAITSVAGKTYIEANDRKTEFDAVILACGFKPRIELAEQAGLETNRGVLVNHYLQSSHANIYAIGDVAELPNNKLYAYVLPIRKQALWLASWLSGEKKEQWQAPEFSPKAKVHDFEATHPYNF